ncbi:F-box/LRR-repeat protein At3g59190-like isoform X1 [Silene latifolia]|uniref:F-box/LRR-repeat protein At3g59190-like isoform X1 n=1 Tax=Silene latifolia TaxID=37657 RepID=UPI003D77DC41
MKSFVKLGKHVEDPRGKGCLDRISSLPDELLGHVLSFLPTRCAVRTSILSKSWRRIFTLTSCLSFNDFDGPTECFTEFVYNVLELHQISPIKKFSLVCQATYDKSDLNTWFSKVVQKGVQEIYYWVFDQEHVPDAIVMCETLVTLEIVNVENFEIPLSAWLPNLKSLNLGCVQFVDYDSMQRLFSACKLLEELTLDNCVCSDLGYVIISAGSLKVLTIKKCTFEDGYFAIDAPNLSYFTYNCNIGMKIVHSWKQSYSLVKLELKFKHCREVSNYPSNEYDREVFEAAAYREVFKAAAYNTTELRLLSDTMKFLVMLADQEQMPDFRSLTRLHLGYIPYDSWKYVTDLLDKSPQLKMVTFEVGLHRCFRDHASPPCEPLFPFSCHAQMIEVRRFCGHKGSLLHLGHLLKNASLLKKLIIHTSHLNSWEDELPTSKDDLLILPRASRDCCIELIDP